MKYQATALLSLLLCTHVNAETSTKPAPDEVRKTVAETKDRDDLAEKAAKELANPNTVYATMNFKFQYSGGFEGGGSNFNTTFQPSMPMPLANGDKIFFRPAISYSQNIDKVGPTGDDGGFSDISFDLAYAPTLSDPTNLLALGTFVTVPTGSDGFSAEQYAAGPEILVGKLSAQRVVGALTTHQWGFAEDDGVQTRNATNMQLLWVEIAGGGWTYGSVPMLSYDWNNDQAEIPLNLMVSKTVIMGQRPWKIGMEVNYYVEKAESRPDFMLSFNISPVVENKLAGLLK
ncbi:hypothetical protein [Vibrio comitans]|uniref:Neuromedin U n=1 Tax=Vibrio comitans NBRC 102076 TaxID=1219078 RepID=A0A4Y3IHM5_9VIBR|nr:hypothetical protein [Vibrio comitans]GEA59009.1 hypothetical protein VCO01S_02020 [Vibrio comitans NBRC 102076]